MIANSFRKRLVGLKKEGLNHLFIPNCRSIHTFGMSRPIDLYWLDKNFKIIKKEKQLKPNRIRFKWTAKHVLEVKHKGNVLLEATLVLPILMVIVFGFIQLGLATNAEQKLVFATQYAAQVGSITNNDAKISGALNFYYEDLDDFEIKVQNQDDETGLTIESTERRYGDILEVETTLPYAINIPLIDIPLINLTAQAKSRVSCFNSLPPHTCLDE